MPYSQLFSLSNFSFLQGASHPQELVRQAFDLGYKAIAITDESSLAGIVKAYVTARELGIQLIVGSCFQLSNDIQLLVLAPDRAAYAELSGFITLARRRAAKGAYQSHLEDLHFRLRHCLAIWLANPDDSAKADTTAKALSKTFKQRLWIGINCQLQGGETSQFRFWQDLGRQYHIPLVACPRVLMHIPERKPLQDTLTAIHHNTSVDKLGTLLQSNGEAYLKPVDKLLQLYPKSLLLETNNIAQRCHFTLDELRYQYPKELVPDALSPSQHLLNLVRKGEKVRWPNGTAKATSELIAKELALIKEMHYEYYFLTVYDIVRFAREKTYCVRVAVPPRIPWCVTV